MRRYLAAVFLLCALVYMALPPRPAELPDRPAAMAEPVRGAFHIHTRRSDGTGTLDQVAAAAARAGLRFIIVTDHGDGTRKDSPQYREGVLIVDAVEISTDGGHVVALDLPQTEYPLGGEPRDVLDDIARLKGFSIAAHPGSDKPALRWIEWTAPFDGIEWLNADSEWRDESRVDLARALLTYPLRRPETLARTLDRPDNVIRRWDVLTGRRRVVALAAADAHARIGLRTLGEPYDNSASLWLPSYESLFRTFSIAAPGVTLSGEAGRDARAVLDAIRAGHVYSTMDAVGGRGVVSFTASSGAARAAAGDALTATGAVTLRVEAQAPADARIVIRRNGEVLTSGQGTMLQHEVPAGAAVYRVEVELPDAPGQPPVPWIVSNPIYVGRTGAPARNLITDPRPPATEFAVQYDNGFAPDITVENSTGSAGAIDMAPTVRGGTELSFRWALSGSKAMAPYVALVMPAGPALSGYDRLMFTARASRPMRVSAQIRIPAGELGERWQRSFYVDTQPRPVTVHFDDMTPRGFTSQRRPVLSNVRSVMFVIDTVHALVGTNGQIWIDDIRYGR